MFPPTAEFSDNSHSARMVLKHVQKQIERIIIGGYQSVVSSCDAIVEMKGSVSLQHLMWHRNAFHSFSTQAFLRNVTF